MGATSHLVLFLVLSVQLCEGTRSRDRGHITDIFKRQRTSITGGSHGSASGEVAISLETVQTAIQILGIKERGGPFFGTLMKHAVNWMACHQTARKSNVPNRDIGVTCPLCKLALAVVQKFVDEGKTNDEIAATIVRLCKTFKVVDDAVCFGLIDNIKDEVGFVLRNSPYNGDEMCAMLFGSTCLTDEIIAKIRWNVPLLDTPKPPVRDIPPPPPDAPKLRVLHITDVHYDPQYQAGSLAECRLPLCCRSTNGKATTSSKGAWKWGDYRSCDMPLWTFEHMLKHIASTQRFDYILWTGDIPSHALWNQSKEEVIYTMQEVNGLLKKYFPTTNIYPAIGNHDTQPTNSFPPPELHQKWPMDWLYGPLSRMWMSFLPKETYPTIRKAGFYSTLIRPGLRLISLNMNYGHAKNWWNLLNYPDPGQMLQWLVNELDKAERSGEKVQILAHIPPGVADCTAPFSENYNKIITRYENTVVGQFYGHTHIDEFVLFFDPANRTRAVNVGFTSPSFTTYEHLNPSYRIYTIDGDWENSTRAILNHQTYYMDLQESQAQGEPNWRLEYSAKEAYGMSALNPQDWAQFVDKMKANDDVLQYFYRHTHRFSKKYPFCNKTCRDVLIASLTTSKSHEIKNAFKYKAMLKC